MDNPFDDDEARPSTLAVSNWPLWTLVALSLLALVVALFNVPRWSIVANIVVVVAAFVLLLVYRLSLVAVTRAEDADASVVGVKTKEKLAIAASVLGSLANGIVIGLEVGSWEMWF